MQLLDKLTTLKNEIQHDADQMFLAFSSGSLQTFPASEAMRLTHRKPFIEARPGCYFVTDSQGQLIYIGSTGNFHKRLGRNRNRQIEKLALTPHNVTIAPLSWGHFYVEQLLIARLRPLCNKTFCRWWDGYYQSNDRVFFNPTANFAFGLNGYNAWGLALDLSVCYLSVLAYLTGKRRPSASRLEEMANATKFTLPELEALFAVPT